MTSFSSLYPRIPAESLGNLARQAPRAAVESVLARGRARTLEDFAVLLSPAALPLLEEMASLSQALTQSHFGRVIRLFAPLYLSNECINICRYCGFSRNNPIPRITLPVSRVVEETRLLAAHGFRSLLLVAGEHPKYVSNGYTAEAVARCLEVMPSIAIELGPLRTEDYAPIVAAGCEGLICYQETYNRPIYRDLHPSGPKGRFEFRLETPERAYAAGFRRLGLGALFGLSDWLEDALCLAAHTEHLLRHCWKAQFTVSFPRLRPAAGDFQVDPAHLLGDRQLLQLICAFRLFLPTCGIVLSTREAPRLRDGLMACGVTHMSAGSCTEPGGYSSFDLSHFSAAGRRQAGEQFHIADERTPEEVAAAIRARGYDPVWKDFDLGLVRPQPLPSATPQPLPATRHG